MLPTYCSKNPHCNNTLQLKTLLFQPQSAEGVASSYLKTNQRHEQSIWTPMTNQAIAKGHRQISWAVA